MCFATPVKVKSKISSSHCQIEDGKMVNTSMVADIQKGDWLLCHADLAINKIDKKEAKIILGLVEKCHHEK